jgi:hypothetical protein
MQSCRAIQSVGARNVPASYVRISSRSVPLRRVRTNFMVRWVIHVLHLPSHAISKSQSAHACMHGCKTVQYACLQACCCCPGMVSQQQLPSAASAASAVVYTHNILFYLLH